MRFIYATDLHGWQDGFDALLDFATTNKAVAMVNGGDMLPKGDSILKAQKRFIQSYLPDYFQRCQAAGIRFYGMFGNDDVGSRLPYWREVIAAHEYAFDLTDRWHELPEGFRIRGVNHVPDAPFGYKEWMVLDSPGWPRPLQTCRAIVSGPNGFEAIPDVERFCAERPTLADILANLSVDAVDMSRSIVVTHAPPDGLGLGTLGGILRGKDVGSAAVHAWIEKHQPLLALHGHIHESPDVTGIHTAPVGRTVCHQPGQKAQLALTVSVIDVGEAGVEIERRFLPVE